MTQQRPKFTTPEEYKKSFSPEVQKILTNLEELVRKVVPQSKEKISYQILCFTLNEKYFVYFAAFKNHIGAYTLNSVADQFREELKNYKMEKGTIQFPLSEPIPYDLIERMVRAKVSQMDSTK